MGRGCKCCNGSEECKNISSDFSTPWIIEKSIFLPHKVEGVEVLPNTISGYVNVPEGTCETTQVDCNYYSQSTTRPCYNCGSDPVGQIIKDPFGNDNWCGISPAIGFPIECLNTLIYPKLDLDVFKLLKIKAGQYTVNLNGFDTYSIFVAFSKKCFNVQNIQCNNLSKLFSKILESSEYISANIIDGPTESFLFIDCIDNTVKMETQVYPFAISSGFIPDSGYPINFNSFTFTVEEDCFFYIWIKGIKFSQVSMTSESCLCPEIRSPMIPCIRPPRPIHVLKKITNINPDSFNFNFEIVGDVYDILPNIQYTLNGDCYV